MTRLVVGDFRAAGFCARGLRRAFEDRGIDFARFCAEGMAVEDAERYLPDAHLERALQRMRERTDERRGR